MERDDLLEDRLVSPGTTVDIVRLGPLPVLRTHAGAQARLLKERLQLTGKAGAIVQWHHGACGAALKEVGLAAAVVADYRQATGHRFQEYQAEALVLAGRHEQVGQTQNAELLVLL